MAKLLVPNPDIFKRNLEAWDCSLSVKEKSGRQHIVHVPTGTVLDTKWNEETLSDLKAFTGTDGDVEIITVILAEVWNFLTKDHK